MKAVLGGTRGISKAFSKDAWSPNVDSKPVPPAHKARLITCNATLAIRFYQPQGLYSGHGKGVSWTDSRSVSLDRLRFPFNHTVLYTPSSYLASIHNTGVEENIWT